MSDDLLELLASPPVPPMAIDERAVYAGGRARVRRRSRVRGGLAAATAIALAGQAWTALPVGGGTALRPGASATPRVVGTICSDTGTNIGDSGPLTFGSATISLRARAGTCDGIRVETSVHHPGLRRDGNHRIGP